jgi:elongation factor Ts
MAISAGMVRELRDKTGAAMMDCKKALEATAGDMDAAIDHMRKAGLAKALKKADRETSDGKVSAKVSPDGRRGSLVAIACETDFVAKTEDFMTFCREVALQIAAMNPQAVAREDMDLSKVEAERALLREKAISEGKPEKIVDKIVDGQINKFFSENVLLEQAYVKDDKKTIEELTRELISTIGENVKIRRFVRYELGEGLEKKQSDFAAEVAAAMQGS